jgi:hypothetical protein
MTDRPEPTEADVERLVAAWYGDSWQDEYTDDKTRSHIREQARLFIVNTPAPEPEPPQERYYVEHNAQATHWWVNDRRGEWDNVPCDTADGAERIVRLLNADEAVRTPACPGLPEAYSVLSQRARELEDQCSALNEELAANANAGQFAESKADRLSARVKELEAGWASMKDRLDRVHAQRIEANTRAEEAEAKVRLLEEEVAIADRHDHDQMLSHLVDEWGARGVAHKLMEAMADDQARQWLDVLRREVEQNIAVTVPVPEDDAQPVEPLFTSEAVNVNGGRVLFIPDDFSIIASTPLDVYAHGARPAPRKVTAELTGEDMRSCMEAAGMIAPDRTRCSAVADAVAILLASKAGA